MIQRWKIFSDFDGTISLVDTADLIVDCCIGRTTRQAIDNQIVSGKVSFRDGFKAQFAGVNLTWADACQKLDFKHGLDPVFPHFVTWAEEKNIPLVVLSSGFEQIIQMYFKAWGLSQLEIQANQVEIINQTWHITFRDNTPLGHDKTIALKKAKTSGYQIIFIGDGISDIPAAHETDVLFAKQGERLATYCQQKGILYYPFTNFDDVLNVIHSRLPEFNQHD